MVPHAMFAHAGQDELHEPGRREQVHLKLISGRIEGHVFGRAVQHRTGVVDQDVDASLLPQHRVDHAVEVRTVPGVHRERVAAGFEKGLHFRYAAGRAVHGVAGAPQVEGGGEPDSGRGAGDQADLAFHRHSSQATGSSCTP